MYDEKHKKLKKKKWRQGENMWNKLEFVLKIRKMLSKINKVEYIYTLTYIHEEKRWWRVGCKEKPGEEWLY